MGNALSVLTRLQPVVTEFSNQIRSFPNLLCPIGQSYRWRQTYQIGICGKAIVFEVHLCNLRQSGL